jgi:tRNA(adenine34) deaminase
LNVHAHEDEVWMALALQQAEAARQHQEVPIGAVLVIDGQVCARAHNRTVADKDPTAHAEILALREAGRTRGDHRVGGTLYVTLEPCVMCMGAMVQARVQRLVFGARDPKAGAAASLYRIAEDSRLNHRFAVTEGVMAEQSAALLSGFFAARRLRKQQCPG